MKKAECLNVITKGNKKLINNDKVRWMIWNLPAITTCPFAADHCKKACYAMKYQRLYRNVREGRENNYNDSLKDDFVARMIATIEYYLQSKAYKGKLILFRIHESGDFYSQEYALKWVEIINHFRDNNRIKFMCYTKSLPYFENVDIRSMKNFSFIASVWNDTTDAMKELIKKNDYRIYTAVTSFENTNYTQCRCSDCAHCMNCFNNNVKAIACKIH